jgi:hypothetical protein
VRVNGTNNIRNDSGVLDPTWNCFVDNIRIESATPLRYPENNWPFCFQDKLVDGPHLLTVNATVIQSQTFWFDNIQYVPSASVSLEDAAVLVDSLDPQLQYGPGWQALGSTANMTSQTNSIFTFDFIGTLRIFFFACTFLMDAFRCISELVWLHILRTSRYCNYNQLFRRWGRSCELLVKWSSTKHPHNLQSKILRDIKDACWTTHSRRDIFRKFANHTVDPRLSDSTKRDDRKFNDSCGFQ